MIRRLEVRDAAVRGFVLPSQTVSAIFILPDFTGNAVKYQEIGSLYVYWPTRVIQPLISVLNFLNELEMISWTSRQCVEHTVYCLITSKSLVTCKLVGHVLQLIEN